MTFKEAFTEQWKIVLSFILVSFGMEALGWYFNFKVYPWIPSDRLLFFYFCVLTIGTYARYYLNNRK